MVHIHEYSRATKRTRVLIMTEAEFRGSGLAEALRKAGYNVFGVDDLSTGSTENAAHLTMDGRPCQPDSAAA